MGRVPTRMATMEQLAFDFDEFAREDARARLPEWAGAPLHYTEDYYPPRLLDEAFEHWRFINGSFGSFARSHMWHRFSHATVEFGEHRAEMFHADLRPEPDAEGPGDLLKKIVCGPCAWQSDAGGESDAVEAWHDHAVPGWRDLPVVPGQIRVRTDKGLSKVALRWIEQRYPQHMQIPGAPIITERQQFGTRHVPAYSPWGGYDLSATALERPAPRPAGHAVRREPAQFEPSVSAPRRTGRMLGD